MTAELPWVEIAAPMAVGPGPAVYVGHLEDLEFWEFISADWDGGSTRIEGSFDGIRWLLLSDYVLSLSMLPIGPYRLQRTVIGATPNNKQQQCKRIPFMRLNSFSPATAGSASLLVCGRPWRNA